MASALRRGDRPARPHPAKRTSTAMDGPDGTPAAAHTTNKKRKLEEPYVRTTDYILRKHRGKPPSMIVHLHPTHFRFENQDGSFAYDSPMKFIIEHLRAQTLPHDLLPELLANNVPFYDGCLVVEVHNHRTAASKDKSKQERDATDDKFSMHRYNEHIVPSGLAPYPSKARADEPVKAEASGLSDKSTKGKDKEKEGSKVTTIVLHPTELSKHHELLYLAQTPAAELLRGKKKSGDAGTSSNAQTPTPSTPIVGTRGPLSQSQKMALEDGDYYAFQGEMLVASEPPLFLDPVSNAEDSHRLIEFLSDPLHNEKPPSPKTRKRTTAEMAADDAQAAEAERRMLIFDTARNTATENQGVAATLGFMRFKTLEMVRQKHDEQERIKKENEERAAGEKKANEDAQQKALAAKQQREQQLLQQQQAQQRMLQQRQQQEAMRQSQIAQAQALAAQQANAQNNPMMQNMQQNFAQQNAMAQGSPVARQQTPMVNNSSPMLQNGGFPMVATSSQGAGSPPRPTSAAMQNRAVSMARQASQQHGSQQNTPQIPQGTPSMAQAMPNRQMTQTPRMPPGSPANAMHTPNSAMMGQMPTPQMNQMSHLSDSQNAMLQAMQRSGMQPGAVPNANLTPEQIQMIRNQQQQQMRQRIAAGQDPRMALQAQQQQLQMARAQQMRQMQMNGHAGSPMPQQHPSQTPQMNHGHPGTPHHPSQTPGGHPGMNPNMPTEQQQVVAQQRAQQMARLRQQQAAVQHLQQVSQQYGGWQNIPSQVVSNLPQHVQILLQQQKAKQQQQLQQHAQRANMMGQHASMGENAVPAGQPNPQYMAALRHNQAMLHASMQQQQQNQQGGGGGGNNAMMQQLAGNMGQRNDHLDQHFANMQNALNQQRGGQ
ncbi:hypothetical protein EJ03DRAFT_329282 [Teratosphaeria nubilosa]|uniref:Spt20-like SEP domain-containing protein n=1 Tax=Teratosphaeria nubilosa TaxID=161662 RepID=A0A6G1L572_9PEZI|nr:hypothetical protein EJ03DRAFT_329282 [Teratosphaeria nubilosa]